MKTEKDLENLREYNDKSNSSKRASTIPLRYVIIGGCIVAFVLLVLYFLFFGASKNKQITPPTNTRIDQSVKDENGGNTDKNYESETEPHLYSVGEMAEVQSEKGNYSFGVTKVAILPKTPYRDAVYQVTWKVENTDFDGLNINSTNLKVVDSNGFVVAPMEDGWEGDWSSTEYNETRKKEKVIDYHTYIINDPECKYLDVKIESRGIVFRAYFDNETELSTEAKLDTEVEENINEIKKDTETKNSSDDSASNNESIEKNVAVIEKATEPLQEPLEFDKKEIFYNDESRKDQAYSITVHGVHKILDFSSLGELNMKGLDPSKAVISVQCLVEDYNYIGRADGSVFPSDIVEKDNSVAVKSSDGSDLKYVESFDGKDEGYSTLFVDKIEKAGFKKIAFMFYVDKNINSAELVVNSKIMELEFDN